MFQTIVTFFSKLHDFGDLLRWGGYAVLMVIVFSETGVFLGFFLPGDSLLVTAGLFAAQGYLNVGALIGLGSLCAILGDTVGFEVGRLTGRSLFTRTESRFFKKQHLERTQAFYKKHGGKAIILARFMPIVRTFAPLVAGLAGMPYRAFVVFNVIGAVLWVGGTVGLGYLLGRFIPNIAQSIDIVIAVVIFVSFLPAMISYFCSDEWKVRIRRMAKKR